MFSSISSPCLVAVIVKLIATITIKIICGIPISIFINFSYQFVPITLSFTRTLGTRLIQLSTIFIFLLEPQEGIEPSTTLSGCLLTHSDSVAVIYLILAINSFAVAVLTDHFFLISAIVNPPLRASTTLE